MHQEKVQHEKLKAVKAHLNFEEILQYSESGELSRRRDVRKRLETKDVRGIPGSPEPRRNRTRSPRRKDPKRETVFRRLEKGIFHRLGDKVKSMSAYSGNLKRQSYHSSCGDIESYYQSSRSQRMEPAPKKHHDRKAHSRKEGRMLESEDSAGGIESLSLRSKGRVWKMRTYPNHGVWFDDLPPESIDSYNDMKEAFLANYLQQKKCIKDPIEIHHIKQMDGESIKDFVQRFEVESRDVKGAPEITTAFLRGEVAAGNKEWKKTLPPWKQQDAGHR
ncbi:reverse transcriptase domain-containing protein [Tanacetum coccineum]|uniref:Reverse transcriptase domain-containing protein n=1 Tax=Tanacetum coccineum TaxID=301880 RepID=A0ABQ4XYJ7_9ASTR